MDRDRGKVAVSASRGSLHFGLPATRRLAKISTDRLVVLDRSEQPTFEIASPSPLTSVLIGYVRLMDLDSATRRQA
jgi:hypothetical protein